jgi:hypothetical protein
MTSTIAVLTRRPLVCMLAVVVLTLGTEAVVHADRASAASSWAGTIEGKVTRSSRWVAAGSTARGDFFITVDDAGQVTGNGVVAYEPTFSTAGLDALLGYAKSATGIALAGIPFLGAFAGASINSFVSVNTSFEPMVVREGTITGALTGDRLTLKWNGDGKGVPFRATILAIKKDVKLTSGRIVVPEPLRGAARVIGGRFAVASSRTASTDDGVTERQVSYWTAHRVG